MTDSSTQLFDPAHLTDQEQARLQNLQGLVAAGIDPYPARVQRTHTIAEARALYESEGPGAVVTVVGRLLRPVTCCAGLLWRPGPLVALVD